MNIHELAGVKKYTMSERGYFDPNKHTEKVARITIEFLIDWDDLPDKEENSRVPNRFFLKEVPIKVIEDSRKPEYNQKGKSITWNIPISIIRMMAIQLNEQLLKQEQVSLKGTKINLHIDPTKNTQRYKKSEVVFKVIDEPTKQITIETQEQTTNEPVTENDEPDRGSFTEAPEIIPPATESSYRPITEGVLEKGTIPSEGGANELGKIVGVVDSENLEEPEITQLPEPTEYNDKEIVRKVNDIIITNKDITRGYVEKEINIIYNTEGVNKKQIVKQLYKLFREKNDITRLRASWGFWGIGLSKVNRFAEQKQNNEAIRLFIETHFNEEEIEDEYYR